MAESRHVSLNPADAISYDEFDLDAAIANASRSVDENRIRGLMIHQCSSELRWCTASLARKYSKSRSLVTRLAIHQGIKKIFERDFVSTIEAASDKVFSLSRDLDDRAWFENGHFSFAITGEKSFHTYIDRVDIDRCGRLGSVLGLKSYVIRQIVLASGLVYSSSLPDHSMNILGEELKRFLRWGQERAQKAERELKRVEREAVANARSTPPRMDGHDVFGD